MFNCLFFTALEVYFLTEKPSLLDTSTSAKNDGVKSLEKNSISLRARESFSVKSSRRLVSVEGTFMKRKKMEVLDFTVTLNSHFIKSL